MTTWGGWVMVNLDPEAPPFEEYASVLSEHFQRWTPEERYVSLARGEKDPLQLENRDGGIH